MTADRVQGAAKGAEIVRMSLLFRVQHMILIASLLALAATGFALMYHDNWLAAALIRLEGGVLYRGLIHRVAAVILMAQLVYHAFYMLVTREGRRELSQLVLRKADIEDFVLAIRYNLGLAGEYPRFGKYGYKEKFQYWGATTGIFLMSLSGLMLWAESFSLRVFPKVVLDLALIVHGYQGLLAFVILLFWHLYIVHLCPASFPMNRAWITGKVSVEYLRQEHPLEYERLKSEGIL